MCENCKHFEVCAEDNTGGICTRFPTPVSKQSIDKCGEFAATT